MKTLVRISSTDPDALDCEVTDTMATHWSSTSDFRIAYQGAAMEDVPETPASPCFSRQ